jgi:hypothetical protein
MPPHELECMHILLSKSFLTSQCKQCTSGSKHNNYYAFRNKTCAMYTHQRGARCSTRSAWCPMLDSQCLVPDARLAVPGARCSTRSAWCPMLDSQCLVPDAQFPLPMVLHKHAFYHEGLCRSLCRVCSDCTMLHAMKRTSDMDANTTEPNAEIRRTLRPALAPVLVQAE